MLHTGKVLKKHFFHKVFSREKNIEKNAFRHELCRFWGRRTKRT